MACLGMRRDTGTLKGGQVLPALCLPGHPNRSRLSNTCLASRVTCFRGIRSILESQSSPGSTSSRPYPAASPSNSTGSWRCLPATSCCWSSSTVPGTTGSGRESPRGSSTNTTPSGCRRESGGFSGGINCATTSSGVVVAPFRSGRHMKC